MRPLWLRLIARVVLITLSLLATGCVNFAKRAGGNRVAVILSVSGGTAPTAEQWALVTAAVRPQLEARGMVLVKNLADADRIIHIDFTPDPLSPTTAGNAVVLGWRVNPLGPLAYVGTPANLTQVNYSSGFSVYNRAIYGYDRFPDNYYGYGNSYSTGGTTSVTPVTPPIDKPKPSPPIKPGETRPPGSTPPSQRDHGRLAGGEPSEHGHSGHRPRPPLPPPEYRFPLSSGGGSSSSRSSSTYASSSGSSSSGSYGNSGSSSSSGGSSYSSSSSSSGSSSYSSSSSYSGSSGSSGGGSSSGFSSSRSSGTSESAAQKQN